MTDQPTAAEPEGSEEASGLELPGPSSQSAEELAERAEKPRPNLDRRQQRIPTHRRAAGPPTPTDEDADSAVTDVGPTEPA